MNGIRLLPAAARVASRWKNDGGTTWPVAAFPEGSGLDDFGWRLSIAEIAEAGPFSRFPGVDRHFAVIKGQVALDIGDQVVPCSAGHEALSFAGKAAVFGRPSDDPVTALNLMVRRGRFVGRLRRVCACTRVAGEGEVTLAVLLTASITASGMSLQRLDVLELQMGAVLHFDRPTDVLVASIAHATA